MAQGFVIQPEEARVLLDDPRNRDVVLPYLSGEDLSQRADNSASRWAIDFGERSLEEAKTYPAPFAIVQERVMPERLAKDARKYPRLVNEWWKFWRTRGELRRALAPLDRCIAMTIHSKVVLPRFVDVGVSYTHGLVVFAHDDDAHFGLFSSGFHWWWAVTHASTMRTDIRYTPTDCFETFAQPQLTPQVAEFGARLHDRRSTLMLDRQEGLTTTYNRVHDPEESSNDIVELRQIHVALDYAVRHAYGWDDLVLDHDFHETKFGARFTFAPMPRQEILDRLLELNHERYADEVRRGLHGKAKSTGKRKPVAEGAMTLGFDGV